MDVAQFDFELPEELIALRPASPRNSARMLVVRADGSLAHALVRDLPDYLTAGDALVVNDTKVIPARLHGRRAPRAGMEGDGPKIEILLHRRLAPNRFSAFAFTYFPYGSAWKDALSKAVSHVNAYTCRAC